MAQLITGPGKAPAMHEYLRKACQHGKGNGLWPLLNFNNNKYSAPEQESQLLKIFVQCILSSEVLYYVHNFRF